MKGTLNKTESGWQVWYHAKEDLFYGNTGVRILPLIDSDYYEVNRPGQYNDGKEVEFEIIEFPVNSISKYAKLVDNPLTKNKTMQNEFITYEQALVLKELGFDEPCLLSLSWINGYNTYTEKSNEPKAWISSNVEIKYDFSQFKVDFKNVYHVEIQIPLYQQAFRWFREKYNLYHVITIADLGKYETGNPDFQCAIYSKDPVVITNMDKYKTYEEAEQACLDKLIEIVKNK